MYADRPFICFLFTPTHRCIHPVHLFPLTHHFSHLPSLASHLANRLVPRVLSQDVSRLMVHVDSNLPCVIKIFYEH